MEIVEETVHEDDVTMPYIPGLLSFRELPLILPALEKLKTIPDLFFVDGQGIAHRDTWVSHLTWGLLQGSYRSAAPSPGYAESIRRFPKPGAALWN
jgi:hypothetical protein